jgi:hypothetical protein
MASDWDAAGVVQVIRRVRQAVATGRAEDLFLYSAALAFYGLVSETVNAPPGGEPTSAGHRAATHRTRAGTVPHAALCGALSLRGGSPR